MVEPRGRLTPDAARPIPSRYLYMIGLLDCLRDWGPVGPQKAYEWLIERKIACEEDRQHLQKDGGSRFHKEARWARQELLGAGLIRRETDGIWGLTEAGSSTFLTIAGARAIVSSRHSPKGVSFAADDPLANEGFAPTTGPVPVSWTGTVTRSLRGVCWSYAVRFGDTSVWKIGLAADVDRRVVELNRHVPQEVIEHQWRARMRHPWPNAPAAYAMEQFVLSALSDARTYGERVNCDEDRLAAAWQSGLRTLAI